MQRKVTLWLILHATTILAVAHRPKISYHFRTYGDAKFLHSKQRLLHEADATGWFNTTAALSPSNLPDAFKRIYGHIFNQSRGGGYWSWKLAVFEMTLQNSMIDGDILVYMDAGCSLNVHAHSRFWDYIAMVRSSPYDVISFQLTHPEHVWTTDRVFQAFGVRNQSDSIRMSNQYMATVIVMQKGPHVRRWFKLVKSVLEHDPWLLTDRYNYEARLSDPDFKEARHDQSIFSVSRKIVGSIVIPDETYPPRQIQFPFWASRIRK